MYWTTCWSTFCFPRVPCFLLLLGKARECCITIPFFSPPWRFVPYAMHSTRMRSIIGERERANLVVQLARFFGIYLYPGAPYLCLSGRAIPLRSTYNVFGTQFTRAKHACALGADGRASFQFQNSNPRYLVQ